MDYYYILLLVISAFLSIKGEENPKRRNLLIGIYLVLIVVAFLYQFGHSIGQFVYWVTNA